MIFLRADGRILPKRWHPNCTSHRIREFRFGNLSVLNCPGDCIWWRRRNSLIAHAFNSKRKFGRILRNRILPGALIRAEDYQAALRWRTAFTREQRAAFSRLARSEPRIAPDYLTFLARAYELKSIADYSVGPTARSITAYDAALAIETAERFIDTIAQLLPPNDPSSPMRIAPTPSM